MNKSIKIFIKWVAGPLLGAWLFWSLWQQVKNQPGLDKALALIRSVPFGPGAWRFWLTLLLVFVNWGIEARKWQLLMRALEKMPYGRALKSVLCGVTLSLNTPNRMGEYAGRVLFVKEGHRLQAVSLSIAGSMAQLIITMGMGCLGILYLLITLKEGATVMGLSAFWLQVFLFGSTAGTLVFALFFFRLGWLVRLVERLPYSQRFTKYVSVLETFDAKILLRLLGLSFLRYVVFVFQYIFMLQLMQVEAGYGPGFWLVSVLFWILAIIPSVAIAELGIRGTVANALFAYSANTVGILAVTFGIWFANLFVPALVGSLLILGIKINKQ
ncbi:MAG: lysylphosphatidylglycerol synthase domain-containing protein [Ferruginibacter sp.]